MSEIKDRQDAASHIDPIVAAMADDMANDSWAAAAVEGLGHDADAAIDATEASDDVPAPEDAVVAEASGSATELGEAADAPFDFVAAEPADLAGILASDADKDFEEAAVPDVTLASEAMPAELATAADEAAEAEAEAAFAEGLTYSALPEAPLPGATETMSLHDTTAAYADTVVELEAPVDASIADDDAPLLDGELEHGIASVFAALHAAAMDGATPPVEPLGELEAADGITFRLLGELDRLWHRAA